MINADHHHKKSAFYLFYPINPQKTSHNPGSDIFFTQTNKGYKVNKVFYRCIRCNLSPLCVKLYAFYNQLPTIASGALGPSLLLLFVTFAL
jgi:hypothetical protein